MKIRNILWYICVVIAAIALVLSYILKNWVLTLLAFALGLFLKSTNKYIELPKIYRELGIKNEVFELKKDIKHQ